ncbi:MAG: hybrid sensor histidine kinase/response regulator [Sphingobacteriia bacterium]|nr:hybrid sensor histidine kinase/response regulator [Sphingobacteriia bacterium]NCC38170.1 hybrid sensor histidine kinase/response regulator [Gammaproteobacteria bacterium]
MLIEDAELRELFRAESAEHIQSLEVGLLRLGQTPDDAALLEELFRQAHSLKGAARMLGLREIQRLAHEIENLLAEARQDKIRITADRVAPQLELLDRMRTEVALVLGESPSPALASLAREAAAIPRAGGETGVIASPGSADGAALPTGLPRAMARSGRAADLGEALSTGSVPPVVAPGTSAASPPPDTSLGSVPDVKSETVRIDSSRLDRLFQLGAELLVSTGRMERCELVLEGLVSRCDDQLKRSSDLGQALAELAVELEQLRAQMSTDSARLVSVARQVEHEIGALRLLPMSTLFDLFPRMLHDLGRELGKEVDYAVEGASSLVDKRVIEELKAPLTHLVRNALDHGIETPEERRRVGKPPQGRLSIVVRHLGETVWLRIRDDGRGLDPEAVRRQAVKLGVYRPEELSGLTDTQLHALILRSGFSTALQVTDLSGRGVGLDVVRATVERLHGTIEIGSTPGQGMQVDLRVPVTLSVPRALLIREWGQLYAIAFDSILFIERLQPSDLHLLGGRYGFYRGDQTIPLERLGLLLERSPPALEESPRLYCLALEVGGERFGLMLDEVLEAVDLVVKPFTMPLKRVRNLAGLAVLDSGSVCVVLDPFDLCRGMSRARSSSDPAATEVAQTPAPARKRILLAEDSITTRMQECRILEAAGYEVVSAVDGLDAWGKLAAGEFDAVVSDIQMPRLSGLELTERIRANRHYAELPVVLVSSLASEEDRRRGLEAGADAFITKSAFDQSMLLDCLGRLA